MKKSVIKSMIFGSLAVMLISLLIVTLVFFYNVKTGFETYTTGEMIDFVEHVKPITKMSLDFSTSRMMKFFNETISQFSHFSKYDIIISTQNGDIVWSDLPFHPSEMRNVLSPIIKDISLESVHKANILSSLYGQNTVTLVDFVKSDVTKDILYIFCTAKIPGITGRFFDMLFEVMLMELVALVFVAFFLYLFSRNITNPLAKINKALKEFSKGDFSRRVEYNSHNELGELASNVNSMADGLENLEKMRSSFISDVSHELRTPLTSVSGFIEGIIDGTIPDTERDKYLKIALSETRRLSRIINDLLSATKLESSNIKLNKLDFDIYELAKIVLLNFENEITQKNIDVTFEADSDKYLINGDKDSYTQVLINLVHNAVKFTPENGYIKICFKDDGKKCTVSIKNSGDGIEKDKLSFIWERFYKTDSSRGSDKSGVGLGLYIVKRIIDAHDEKITVETSVGESTTFTFTATLS